MHPFLQADTASQVAWLCDQIRAEFQIPMPPSPLPPGQVPLCSEQLAQMYMADLSAQFASDSINVLMPHGGGFVLLPKGIKGPKL